MAELLQNQAFLPVLPNAAEKAAFFLSQSQLHLVGATGCTYEVQLRLGNNMLCVVCAYAI